MNIYSKLLKQLNMCGHAVLVTDYPSSDTSDGTAASAVCHQTSRKTILSAVPGQMKPDNGTILPVSGSSASCSSVCGTLPPINTTLAQTALSEGSPVLDRDHGHIRLLEPFSRKERLLILGGDHVGLALAEFAAKTGFSVYVADDRPCFANQLRFPWAEEVYCMDFPAAIQAFQPDTQDYIAVLTRGHRHDADCLTALSHCPVPTYLGMIGSRRRVKELKTHLEETEHLSHEWLESIHTPIGLAIKAVTPEEIAISILAELILTKRTLRPDHIAPSDADLDVIAALADPPANRTDLKKALATIVETKGSTPRKAGANMIVYEDGCRRRGGVRRMDDDGSASSTCRIRNERFHRNNSSANKMDSTFSILTQTAPHHAYQVPLCVRTGPSISSNIVATDGSAGSILFPS